MMKNIRSHAVVVTALTVVTLALTGVGEAADIGANDDTGKFAADGGSVFFDRMSGLGLRQTVMTVRFVPGQPETIQGKEFLDNAVPAAASRGLKVVFAIYPYPPSSLTRTASEVRAFADYAALVARTYPQVQQFVVGNEPNQPAFWRPQFSSRGVVLSAPSFGRYLAAAYDALKDVDSGITVVGVGLSPRGNDNAIARNNVSTSPVRFLSSLGAWYRHSGRTKPLMDGFAFHPYPRAATDPLLRGYDWPNAGFVNLTRVKQAFWDAFHDTPQPTTEDGLKLYLNEVGWQVRTTGLPGYTGSENVPVTTERKQAAVYADLVRRSACDPDVAEVNFFGFYDDVSRDQGFQAALNRLDGTPRPSSAAVSAAIAKTSRHPCRQLLSWAPATTVTGARMGAPKLQRSGAIRALVGAKEGATALVCLIRTGSSTRRQVSSVSSLLRSAVAPCWRGQLTPRFGLTARLDVPVALRGLVLVAARISAQANPARGSSFVAEASGP